MTEYTYAKDYVDRVLNEIERLQAVEDARLERIEDLLRNLLAALIRMNERLDVVCGHQMH